MNHLEKAIRTEILTQLRKVKPGTTPNVFAAIQTPEGYKGMESRIINMMITDNITPGACIAQIESEM